MAKKIRLGLNLFFSNYSNSGIVNYIYNIISALKTLPQNQQPSIVVFHSKEAPLDYLEDINYPDIQFILYHGNPSNRILNKLNRVFYKISGLDLYKKLNYFNKIDVLYPYFEFMDSQFKNVKHKIHWLVDFNNCAFPGHYADGGKSMADFQRNLTSRKDHLILSSNSLLDEMNLYYKDNKNKVSILRFACTLPNLDAVNFSELKKKYGLVKPYFMSPNQFWEHKNQLILIEALNILKISGDLDFQVVFTGSMEVNRGKGHILSKLLDAVKQYQLENTVKFLGIIDRHEQLMLMRNAKALIQPSLYEGWSTLVEEAKALNQKIILSDLAVHREQACVNSFFFNPGSAVELADQIKRINDDDILNNVIDYKINVIEFGKDILSILKDEVNG